MAIDMHKWYTVKHKPFWMKSLENGQWICGETALFRHRDEYDIKEISNLKTN